MMHSGRAHARLSASGAYIWMVCRASPALSEGVARRPSKWADEGTRAHELAERMLRERGIGTKGGDAPADDAGMAAGAKVFVDYVAALVENAILYGVEQRVSLDGLWPGGAPEAMFGTSDFFAVTRDKVLHVADFKYGAGVVVEPKDNVQLLYYALGVWLLLIERGVDLSSVETVRVTIVQPRARHEAGPVRHWDLPLIDLLLWAHNDLKPAVEDIAFGGAHAPVEGPHCRWCPAATGSCPLKARSRSERAAEEFNDGEV